MPLFKVSSLASLQPRSVAIHKEKTVLVLRILEILQVKKTNSGNLQLRGIRVPA